ncbi:MAG: hypothetical protein HY420_04070 [Candidatus Kerfeldbacteria bacterium]|nr:hypothetical protein [Candidatus Kerfeldbacteria bacterium]
MNILIVVAPLNGDAARFYGRLLREARGFELSFCSTKGSALSEFRRHRHDAVVVHGDAEDYPGQEVISAFVMERTAPAKLIGVVPPQRNPADYLAWGRAGATDILGPALDTLQLLKALGITLSIVPTPK